MNFDDYQLQTEGKASLVSIVCESFKGHQTEDQTQASLKELNELLRTLGLEPGNEYVQNKKTPEAATVLGSGKLGEIADRARSEGSTILVFDFELTASQVRNIKALTDMDVIDRNTVILEIFAKHAQTAEAKIQIEISRLEYLLPRLTSLWTHFSRQKGAIGVRGGEGEQQIELDRRMIRKKIESFKRQLKEVAKSRKEQKKKRKEKAVTAALVGYTNAGKSTLMNKLCKVNILAEDKLFATLDSTYRMLNPDTKPPMILIDTVGFISNLPTSLINGFKTTLESALEADLLIIVVDVSDPQYKKHIEVTEQVLKELNIKNKEKIIVFNKSDRLEGKFVSKLALRSYKDSFLTSSHSEEDISTLRNYILNYFLEKQDHYDLFIPYEDAKVQSTVRANTNIINEHHHENGIFYRIRIPVFIFNSLNLKEYLLSPDMPSPF